MNNSEVKEVSRFSSSKKLVSSNPKVSTSSFKVSTPLTFPQLSFSIRQPKKEFSSLSNQQRKPCFEPFAEVKLKREANLTAYD
jgi:hypothetical protein